MESSLAQIHQCLFDAVINALDSKGIAAASRYFEECTDHTEKKEKTQKNTACSNKFPEYRKQI